MSKPNTYIKKSDSNKSWNKRKLVRGKQSGTKTVNSTILIVCEGHTEELYFKSFPVLSVNVEAIAVGKSKLQLVDEAKNKSAEYKYSQVWCVFDFDIKPDEINCIPDFDNAITKAKKLGFEVAYSNDAFELWFFLHYRYTDTEHHRTFYYEYLSKMWNINYEKDGKTKQFASNIYSKLESDDKADVEEAGKRACKLFEAKKSLPFHEQNPVTLVYQLVEILNKNKRS